VRERPESWSSQRRVREADGSAAVAVPLGIGQAVFLIQQDGGSGRNGLVSSNETPSGSYPSTGSSSRWDG
jgi:hypothetical protein